MRGVKRAMGTEKTFSHHKPTSALDIGGVTSEVLLAGSVSPSLSSPLVVARPLASALFSLCPLPQTCCRVPPPTTFLSSLSSTASPPNFPSFFHFRLCIFSPSVRLRAAPYHLRLSRVNLLRQCSGSRVEPRDPQAYQSRPRSAPRRPRSQARCCHTGKRRRNKTPRSH